MAKKKRKKMVDFILPKEARPEQGTCYSWKERKQAEEEQQRWYRNNWARGGYI